MRIHDVDDDKTIKNADIYLTTSEAVELQAFLYDMINKQNVKHGRVSDSDFEHNLNVHLYNEFEQSGYNRRQKLVIVHDS